MFFFVLTINTYKSPLNVNSIADSNYEASFATPHTADRIIFCVQLNEKQQLLTVITLGTYSGH